MMSLISFLGFAQSQENPYPDKLKSKEWKSLLDKELSQWEVWTGVPEPSVKNLPKNYKKEINGDHKQPVGLGDPMGVFKVVQEEHEDLILNISGEVYAGLTSRKVYSNYHITLLFKWGEKKYEPRLDRKRDNGLLYHCYGEHGAFWNVWKRSLESQIQEGDFGDLYLLGGTKAKVKVNEEKVWDPKFENLSKEGRVIKSVDMESPKGEWTRVDLYVLDDRSVHVINGTVVLALTDARTHEGKVLSSGQIQIQSEGAECFMKDIHIRPITKFPDAIEKAAGFN